MTSFWRLGQKFVGILVETTSLNFLQRHEKYPIGSYPQVLCAQESIFNKKTKQKKNKKKLGFSKAIGVLSPPYLAIDKFECSVHIYRGPWINWQAKHSLITGDSPETGIPACETCYCRPMWCLTCLGKWFAMRQDKNRPDTWLSSKCPCPTCRSKFCLLDVSLISWRKIYFISYCLK